MAIVKCQQHDRPTRPNPAVERLIMDLPVMDEEVRMSSANDFRLTFVWLWMHADLIPLLSLLFSLQTLYQRSLEVEPRSSQPSKIKKLMMQGTAS